MHASCLTWEVVAQPGFQALFPNGVVVTPDNAADVARRVAEADIDLTGAAGRLLTDDEFMLFRDNRDRRMAEDAFRCRIRGFHAWEGLYIRTYSFPEQRERIEPALDSARAAMRRTRAEYVRAVAETLCRILAARSFPAYDP